MMKNIKAESLETVHTHTHTHTPYFYRIGGQPGERELHSKEQEGGFVRQSDTHTNNFIKEKQGSNTFICDKDKGITLVALVVTIVVLLILAGVTIMYVLGDNSIFKTAGQAKEDTKRESAVEKVELMLADYMPKKHTETKTLEEYLKEQKGKGNLEEVTKNDDGTITVEVDGYEITIKEEDLSIVRTEKAGGVRAKVKIETTKTDGKVLTGDETQKAITVNITNIAEIGENYTIEVKDKDGNAIKKEDSVIDGVTGQASYIIKKRGSYTITVVVTKDGIEKTTTKTENITLVMEQIEEGVAFSRANGVIDIVWLNKDNTVRTESEGPLSPKGNLGNLTAIKYDGTKWTKADEDNKKNADNENDWYDYRAQAGNTKSGGTSRWANAVANFNEDSGTGDAYFVWIPRYAYKITYFETSTDAEAYRADRNSKKGIIGYSNINGLVDVSTGVEKLVKGSEPINLAKTGNEINKVKSTEYADYIPHPAFEFDGAKEGIWVGKFESSGSTSKVTIIPNTASLRSTTVSNIFTACQGVKTTYSLTGDSHMMKNTEWGVVSYLAESKYGRNGTEITINGSSSYYTGGGTGDSYKTTNAVQSTTGNIYGIYDMNGGAWEYVAGVLDSNKKNGNNTNKDNYYDFTNITSKYYNTYTDYSNSKGIKGDAVFETSTTGSNSTSWHSDSFSFPYTSHPVFARGR